MKSTSITILLLVSVVLCYGQFGETQAKGAMSLGMAGADVSNIGTNGMFSNQAGLAKIQSTSVMLSAVQPYSIEQVSDVSLALVVPFKSLGAFGIGISSYRFSAFTEQMIGLAYARSLGRNVHIGTKFNLINVGIEGFGNSFNTSVEIGIQTQILEDLSFSAHVLSPISTNLIDDQMLPTRLSIGLAYRPSDRLIVSLEGSKYIDGLFSVALGVDYQIIDLLSLRLGVATNPGLFSAGIALHLAERYNIELGFSIHEILGMTPGITLSYVGMSEKE